MRTLTRTLAALTLLIPPCLAQAEVTTFQFDGQISFVSPANAAGPSLSNGMLAQGEFTYDPSTPYDALSQGDASRPYYQLAIYRPQGHSGFRVSIDGHVFESSALDIFVTQSTPGSTPSVLIQSRGGLTVDGQSFTSAGINLALSPVVGNAGAVGVMGLPVAYDLAQPTSQRELTLSSGVGSDDPGFWYFRTQINGVTAVPEPTSAALMLLGLACTAFATRQRPHKQRRQTH